MYFSDTYLFCLYKDPDDTSKMRPITVPTALRRVLASHVVQYGRDRFARDLLPYNFAIGVKGGMNFVIKATQLAAERYIEQPELRGECPTRSIMYFDFKNMFNEMSREEVMDILEEEYPELVALCWLLYGDGNSVYFNWADGTWRRISVWEGLNQGCPLSGLLAALVMGRIVRPVDELLRARAAARLADNNPGDDGHGGVTHFMGWVDDLTAAIPLEDVRFCCEQIRHHARPRGGILNELKGRLQTSCLGRPIDPILRPLDPTLADDIAWTIGEFSCKKGRPGTDERVPYEVTEGQRLLGAPVGSSKFARKFCEGRVEEAAAEANMLTANVPDLQTRMRLFAQCTTQKLPYLLGDDIMFHMPLDEAD
ncbi:hypothetical protein ACHAWF_017394, partial [Thalassiosira exigua]